MVVVDTAFFKTFKEKNHIIEQIKRKYKSVKLAFTENLIIYQYDDGKKDC